VLGPNAVVFVHAAVAVVVSVVTAALFDETRDARILVVAVRPVVAVPNGISVTVRITRRVGTPRGVLDAAIDGARIEIGARNGFALSTAKPGLTLLLAVAVDVIRAERVIGFEATAADFEIAPVDGAVDAVVTLVLVGAGPSPCRIGACIGVSAGVRPLPCRTSRSIVERAGRGVATAADERR
jgi:hypothetical protein